MSLPVDVFVGRGAMGSELDKNARLRIKRPILYLRSMPERGTALESGPPREGVASILEYCASVLGHRTVNVMRIYLEMARPDAAEATLQKPQGSADELPQFVRRSK
jgi:hypothetical protein